MYLIQTYHDYFKRTNQNLYGSKKVNMPTPELYVIFTGERKNIPDTISFSKEFFDGVKIAIDAEVKVLYQENEKDIRVSRKQGTGGKALQARPDIMMTLFDDEQILKAYAKDIDDNATHREAGKTAEKLIRKGKMSLDEIADCIPALTLDELKKLEAEVIQLA